MIKHVAIRTFEQYIILESLSLYVYVNPKLKLMFKLPYQ